MTQLCWHYQVVYQPLVARTILRALLAHHWLVPQALKATRLLGAGDGGFVGRLYHQVFNYVRSWGSMLCSINGRLPSFSFSYSSYLTLLNNWQQFGIPTIVHLLLITPLLKLLLGVATTQGFNGDSTVGHLDFNMRLIKSRACDPLSPEIGVFLYSRRAM